MVTTGDLEIEVKIRLESFADYLKLLGCLGPIDREEHHVNAFFDSADRQLSKAGYALRVRASEQFGEVTLKGRSSGSDDLAVRQEINGAIEAGLARSLIAGHVDVMSLKLEPIAVVCEKFPDLEPELWLQFKNHRMVKAYRIGDHDLLLEIDKTEFADGSIEYEVEIELESEDQHEAVIDSLRHLFHSLEMDFATQPKSKFERALDRA